MTTTPEPSARPLDFHDLLADGDSIVELGWGWGLPGDPEGRCSAWLFAYRGEDPAASLRAALDAWLEHVGADIAAGGDPDFDRTPNWGDFINGGVDELAAAGLRLLTPFPVTVLPTVNHDEILGDL